MLFVNRKHSSPKGFWNALSDNGAEFPETFTDNLYAIIQRMKPKANKKRKAISSAGADGDDAKPRVETADTGKLKKQFPGLAIPDSDPPMGFDVFSSSASTSTSRFDDDSEFSFCVLWCWFVWWFVCSLLIVDR
jgi:hypothetical protein